MEIFLTIIYGIFSGLILALGISLFLVLAICLPILILAGIWYLSYNISNKISKLIGFDICNFEIIIKEHNINFVTTVFAIFIFVVLLMFENKVLIYLIQYLSDLKTHLG